MNPIQTTHDVTPEAFKASGLADVSTFNKQTMTEGCSVKVPGGDLGTVMTVQGDTIWVDKGNDNAWWGNIGLVRHACWGVESDVLRTVWIETGLGTLTVSHEDIDAQGGLGQYLRNEGYITQEETEDNISHGAGRSITRAEYDALEELR